MNQEEFSSNNESEDIIYPNSSNETTDQVESESMDHYDTYDENDVIFRTESRENLFEVTSSNPNYIGAILCGIIAGAIASALWGGITYATGYSIGYIALLVGYVIGYGVYIGSGKIKSTALQLISAAIAVVAIIGGSYVTTSLYLNDSFSTQYAGYYSEFIWLSPFNTDFISYMISSPVTIFIWVIGVMAAFRVPGEKTTKTK